MKRLIIIVMILIMTTGLYANPDLKEDANFYIKTFQVKRITYQGQEGYFIPLEGYDRLTYLVVDYSYQKYLIEDLQKKEKNNFYLRNGLGISISINVGLALVAIGSGFLIYSMK